MNIVPFFSPSSEDFTNKWSTVGFNAQTMIGLNASDFEVVDGRKEERERIVRRLRNRENSLLVVLQVALASL